MLDIKKPSKILLVYNGSAVNHIGNIGFGYKSKEAYNYYTPYDLDDFKDLQNNLKIDENNNILNPEYLNNMFSIEYAFKLKDVPPAIIIDNEITGMKLLYNNSRMFLHKDNNIYGELNISSEELNNLKEIKDYKFEFIRIKGKRDCSIINKNSKDSEFINDITNLYNLPKLKKLQYGKVYLSNLNEKYLYLGKYYFYNVSNKIRYKTFDKHNFTNKSYYNEFIKLIKENTTIKSNKLYIRLYEENKTINDETILNSYNLTNNIKPVKEIEYKVNLTISEDDFIEKFKNRKAAITEQNLKNLDSRYNSYNSYNNNYGGQNNSNANKTNVNYKDIISYLDKDPIVRSNNRYNSWTLKEYISDYFYYLYDFYSNLGISISKDKNIKLPELYNLNYII